MKIVNKFNETKIISFKHNNKKRKHRKIVDINKLSDPYEVGTNSDSKSTNVASHRVIAKWFCSMKFRPDNSRSAFLASVTFSIELFGLCCEQT